MQKKKETRQREIGRDGERQIKRKKESATYAPLEITRHDLAEYGRDSDTVTFYNNTSHLTPYWISQWMANG